MNFADFAREERARQNLPAIVPEELESKELLLQHDGCRRVLNICWALAILLCALLAHGVSAILAMA